MTDIPISFAVCVGPNFDNQWLDALIESIRAQNVPEYEIILAFDANHQVSLDKEKDLSVIYVDGWLPQKKNAIARKAKYETLCIVHDYYLFDDDWYMEPNVTLPATSRPAPKELFYDYTCLYHDESRERNPK